MSKDQPHRRGYEFSNRTKRRKLKEQKSRCAGCEQKKDLEAHHLFPIMLAFKLELSLALIKQLENCVLLCTDCHSKLHKELNGFDGDYEVIYFNVLLEHLKEKFLEDQTQEMFPQRTIQQKYEHKAKTG